jgi:hypothetical protein
MAVIDKEVYRRALARKKSQSGHLLRSPPLSAMQLSVFAAREYKSDLLIVYGQNVLSLRATSTIQHDAIAFLSPIQHDARTPFRLKSDVVSLTVERFDIQSMQMKPRQRIEIPGIGDLRAVDISTKKAVRTSTVEELVDLVVSMIGLRSA